MTDILLTVSVGCNLWFLFLLLYDRIMDTRLVRFFRGIAGLWRSSGGKEEKRETAQGEASTETADIIGKSRFSMASARTTAATPVPHTATSEKGIALSEEEATFDEGNTETASRTAQVPEEKLDETRPSRTSHRRNWSSTRMNRQMKNRTRDRHPGPALTKSGKPSV